MNNSGVNNNLSSSNRPSDNRSARISSPPPSSHMAIPPRQESAPRAQSARPSGEQAGRPPHESRAQSAPRPAPQARQSAPRPAPQARQSAPRPAPQARQSAPRPAPRQGREPPSLAPVPHGRKTLRLGIRQMSENNDKRQAFQVLSVYSASAPIGAGLFSARNPADPV